MGLLDFLKKKPADPKDGKALCAAIMAVAGNDNRQTRTALYQLLLKSWLYVPTPELPPAARDGQTSLPPGVPIQFTLVKNREGRDILPAFTDADALRNWDPNTPYFSLPAQDYFKIAAEMKIEEIRINLYDPIRKPLRPGGSITRRELLVLAQGQIPPFIGQSKLQVKSGQQVVLGIPADPLPDDIQLRIREMCLKLGQVRKAYYALMAIPPEAPTHTIALTFEDRVDESQKETCFMTLLNDTRAVLPEGFVITLVEAKGSMGESFRTSGKELFSK